MGGGEKHRVLVMEISTLVKTALSIYYSMLSPLALPCLPNHEVVYDTTSFTSVFIEAKRRLSVIDHHNHSRRHHHHPCSVWSDVILLLRS